MTFLQSTLPLPLYIFSADSATNQMTCNIHNSQVINSVQLYFQATNLVTASFNIHTKYIEVK